MCMAMKQRAIEGASDDARAARVWQRRSRRWSARRAGACRPGLATCTISIERRVRSSTKARTARCSCRCGRSTSRALTRAFLEQYRIAVWVSDAGPALVIESISVGGDAADRRARAAQLPRSSAPRAGALSARTRAVFFDGGGTTRRSSTRDSLRPGDDDRRARRSSASATPPSSSSRAGARGSPPLDHLILARPAPRGAKRHRRAPTRCCSRCSTTCSCRSPSRWA